MEVINKKLWKNLDAVILLTIFALFLIGVAFIINARAAAFTGEETGFSQIIEKLDFQYAWLQLLWFVLGLVLMALVCLVDYHTYADLINVAYVILVALLLLVLILGWAGGDTTRGIAGWLKFGERSFQPSEIFKIVLIVVMAKYAAGAVETNGRAKINKEFFKVILFVGVPVVLVALQPDGGTAFVYLVIIAVVLFSAKISLKAVASFAVLGVSAAVAAFFIVMKPYQKARILYFFNLQENEALLDLLRLTSDQMEYFKSTQDTAALQAAASGGFWGKGFFEPGSLVKMRYLPEAHTDFIFASGIEAVGFVGGVVILALYAILLMRAMYLAYKAKDNLGAFIIIGVVAMEFAHIFENIGMNIGLMPITGIPLPFISYGGSSMWTNMIAFGLVLNVAMRRPTKRSKGA